MTDARNSSQGMTAEQLMERWLEHDRRRQDSLDRRFGQQADQINQLSSVVSALTADVRTLVENQKGLFNRTNRPTNWQAIIGAITLWGTATWLLMMPVEKDLTRMQTFVLEQRNLVRDEAYRQGAQDTDITWLKNISMLAHQRIYEATREHVPPLTGSPDMDRPNKEGGRGQP